jgi:hypothetical protein
MSGLAKRVAKLERPHRPRQGAVLFLGRSDIEAQALRAGDGRTWHRLPGETEELFQARVSAEALASGEILLVQSDAMNLYTSGECPE